MLWEQGPSSLTGALLKNQGKGETAGMTPHQETDCLTEHCAEMGLPGHHCLMHSGNRDAWQSDWKSQAPQEWAPIGQHADGTLHFSPGKNLLILSSKIVKSGNLNMLRSSCFILWYTHFAHTHSQTHIHAYTHTHAYIHIHIHLWGGTYDNWKYLTSPAPAGKEIPAPGTHTHSLKLFSITDVIQLHLEKLKIDYFFNESTQRNFTLYTTIKRTKTL